MSRKGSESELCFLDSASKGNSKVLKLLASESPGNLLNFVLLNFFFTKVVRVHKLKNQSIMQYLLRQFFFMLTDFYFLRSNHFHLL